MSLYFYTRPMETSLFNIFDDDDFFNHQLISRNDFGFGHPCRTYGYRGHCKRPYHSLEKQLSKILNDNEIFKFKDFSPKINLSEDKKNYYIHADLPGIKKEEIKMELDENGILTISGERESFSTNDKDGNTEEKMKTEETNSTTSTTHESKPEENKPEEAKSENETKANDERKYNRIECNYGKFERSFSIPEDGDLQSIQAKMENGVLEVMIPKIESPKKQNRTIQIQ